MNQISKPAVEVIQGKRKIYLTAFSVEDFLTKNFHRIDKLDMKSADGYQRILDERRAKRFARDILEAADEGGANSVGECFYPTSVFLTTEHKVSYDGSRIEFDIRDVCPFNVVDGQHRITALLEASKKNPSLKKFPMPVILAVEMDEISEMIQFLIVNTTQKSVDKGVVQHIYYRLFEMRGFEDLPSMPDWVAKQAGKGHDNQAIKIVQYLNERFPWKGKIAMADEKKESHHVVDQKGLVTSLKKYIFSANNKLYEQSVEYKQKFLSNYWKAVVEVIYEEEGGEIEEGSNVLKSIGLSFFHGISSYFVRECLDNRDAKVAAIVELFKRVNENLADDTVHVMMPHFWKKGGDASGKNMAAVDKLIADYVSAIESSADDKEVEF